MLDTIKLRLDHVIQVHDVVQSIRYASVISKGSDLFKLVTSAFAVLGSANTVMGTIELAELSHKIYKGKYKRKKVKCGLRAGSSISKIFSGIYDAICGSQKLQWVSTAAKVTRTANVIIGVSALFALADIGLSGLKLRKLRALNKKDEEKIKKLFRLNVDQGNQISACSDNAFKERIHIEMAKEVLKIALNVMVIAAVIILLTNPLSGMMAISTLLLVATVSSLFVPSLIDFIANKRFMDQCKKVD